VYSKGLKSCSRPSRQALPFDFYWILGWIHLESIVCPFSRGTSFPWLAFFTAILSPSCCRLLPVSKRRSLPYVLCFFFRRNLGFPPFGTTAPAFHPRFSERVFRTTWVRIRFLFPFRVLCWRSGALSFLNRRLTCFQSFPPGGTLTPPDLLYRSFFSPSCLPPSGLWRIPHVQSPPFVTSAPRAFPVSSLCLPP